MERCKIEIQRCFFFNTKFKLVLNSRGKHIEDIKTLRYIISKCVKK